ATHFGKVFGDDGRDLFPFGHAYDGNEVPFAGNGVDFGDTIDIGDGLRCLRNLISLSADQHNGSNHYSSFHMRADEHRFGPMKSPLRAHIALIAMVIIWGVNFSVAKMALARLSPLTFNALRFPLASLL